MHSAHCLNCSTALEVSQKFCPECGQKTDTHRLSLGHISHDLIHAFLHADKGFLQLLKDLLVKPGIVALEYVEGKRKKYFNPFTFLVIIVAITTFFAATNKVMNTPGARPNAVVDFMNTHFNLVLFFTVPLIAFVTWLFFKKEGKNYSEHLVLAAYTSGQRSAFFNIIVIPLLVFFREYYFIILYSYIAIYILYYAWACTQFYNKRNTWTFIKGALVNIVVQSVITGLIILITILYYRFFYVKH